MGIEDPKDPLKGVDWKAIGSELQTDPTAGTKPVIKKKLPKKIRPIPECYLALDVPPKQVLSGWVNSITDAIPVFLLLSEPIRKRI